MRLAALTLTAGSMATILLLVGGTLPRTCKLTIELVDADSGKPLAGLVRLEHAEGQPVPLEGLVSRGLGLGDGSPISRWSVVLERDTVNVPREKLSLEAVQGLETELARVSLDPSDQDQVTVKIPLRRFYRPGLKGYRSANTHLHLMKLPRDQADRYLREIPRADGLDIVFLSYLERAGDDREYISNRYTKADLQSLSASAILFGNGEEHRHNFTAQGEGYGHVMLLDIQKLVQPVSIGPGIMKQGTDGIPMQRGIDTARGDGATVLWCHNNWGMEDVPNWVSGRLDAQNIFDGGTHGSYKDSFYRYLNAGLRVPFSTGTDWFLYDFSRAYVHSPGPLSVQSWLRALAAGKSYITNGPFLELSVSGKDLGEVVSLPNAGNVQITGRAVGRVDFQRVELVQNGRVVHSAGSRSRAGHFVAEISLSLKVTEPCWLALRIPPPPIPEDPQLQAAVPLNELGQPLFAHTSPIYVELGGKAVFDPAVAKDLLAEVERNRSLIAQEALFANDDERAAVLDVHTRAIETLRQRLGQ
ncbi:MAG: CehA/McbA family metallohydrolase [Planctomycetes bacterium]|nr:CehA/McbA family metallohydrolase [Planctomycetota bacterium]